jgi:hypothetical protein
MGNEEETREKTNLESNRAISLLLGGKPEGKENKPKNENPCRDMDKKIDQMVTKNIEATEIEVKGKGKVGKEADALRITMGEEPYQPFQGEGMKVDSGIVDNIWPVIKLPRDLERIGIEEGGDNS